MELSNGEKRSRNRGPPPSWGRRPRDDYRRRSPPPRRRYLRAYLEVWCNGVAIGAGISLKSLLVGYKLTEESEVFMKHLLGVVWGM